MLRIKLGRLIEIKLGRPELTKREEKLFMALFIIEIIAITIIMIMNYRG